MSRDFQHLDFECWQYSGPRLGLTNLAFCLRADQKSIRHFIEAVDEVSLLVTPARRSLQLKPSSRTTGCRTIRIITVEQDGDQPEMSAFREEEVATFEFISSGLERFRKALSSWEDGAEDFSFRSEATRLRGRMQTNDSTEIWFWREMEP